MCWGENDHSEAGDASNGALVAPVRVLASAGGAPVMGVIDLTDIGTGTGNGECFRNASRLSGSQRAWKGRFDSVFFAGFRADASDSTRSGVA